MNGIPLNSRLPNGTSRNIMLYWMESHWSQCYWMEHQCIQCYNEWNPTEFKVTEWNINGFNVVLNGIEVKVIEWNISVFNAEWNPTEMNGTSVILMFYWKESHCAQYYRMERQWIQCYIELIPTEVNVIEWEINELNTILNGIQLK